MANSGDVLDVNVPEQEITEEMANELSLMGRGDDAE